ncbi:NuA4 histone H4 acetyltransferase complex and the SWR1 complex subunit [Serendipita sp. 396]|nr:NuA4 histone H4 acetyltransferase complex and the SWR1 complex subunit [Serendipita sp. 396]KAG8786220.1 NuA4 histone H4 acetyltransferase complex and the SWR1 complex subunit [Serendipita sp. 397]KAG8831014.1 NuA4 histone H4 acetyltransferase complex and the SWR1 complex subunit [Serendipita sp. 400]KAG8852845.1 NuA4 histone H4 acetyltransferase complex and the SWR1 complex subunit [Serendipita sp. 411]KAG8870144.1 NuA4 histone H4 acetyltransferase complex and the SWR1 complex subunit [Sere
MPADNLRQRGVQIVRPIVYGNTARMLTAEDRALLKPPPDHTHRWTVALRSAASHATNGENEGDQIGGKDDMSYFIKRVTFKLHESIENPSRVVDKPPFETSATGWGEFEIQIRVAFTSECNEKPITLLHLLKLHAYPVVKSIQEDPHLPLPPPIQSWQYDEIVFTDPQDNLVNLFVNHPPTPLPPPSLGAGISRPIPWHLALPKSIIGDTRNVSGEGIGNQRAVPGFHNQLAKEEGERLKAAVTEIKTMIEKTRNTLEQKEKELALLRSRA